MMVTSGFLSICRYISVNHKRVVWDVNIGDVSVNFPWRNTASEYSNLVTPLYYQTKYILCPILFDNISGLISFTVKGKGMQSFLAL